MTVEQVPIGSHDDMKFDREFSYDINDMYMVPGREPITLEKFEWFKKAHNSLIRKLPDIILKNLKKWDKNAQSDAIKCIPYAPGKDRTKLITEALGLWDGYKREETIEAIPFAPEQDRTKLIETVIGSLVGKFLSNKYFMEVAIIKVIKYAPVDDRVRLLKRFADSEDPIVQSQIVCTIPYLPEMDRARYIKLMLNNNKSTTSQEEASVMIKYAAEADRADLVELALGSENNLVRHGAIGAIEYAITKDQPRLLERALDSDDDGFTLEIVLELIKRLVSSEDDRIRLYGLAPPMIVKGFLEKKEEIIIGTDELEKSQSNSEGLQNNKNDPLSPEKEAVLKKIAQTAGLYGDWKPFMTRDLDKLGNLPTTLLGEVPGLVPSLKGRAIIRHMRLSHYLTWYKAFVDYQIWKEEGFDYVPIEPIIRVSQSKKPMYVDVAAQVLGPDVTKWKNAGGLFLNEIKQQKNKIIKTLQKLGINYGPPNHYHDGNFCLIFYKDKYGEIDLTRPPRVYCIDFDHAVSVPIPMELSVVPEFKT